jgi:hypothetical protein
MPDGGETQNTPPGVEAMSYELVRAVGFPPENIPTVFVDGVANLSPTRHSVKFYLFRIDPDITGAAKFRNTIVAQVVMPIDASWRPLHFLIVLWTHWLSKVP